VEDNLCHFPLGGEFTCEGGGVEYLGEVLDANRR
jgi:hypothetical protein